MTSSLAGALFYTKDRRVSREDGHVPSTVRYGTMLEVTTGHEMNSFAHDNNKHVVLDNRLQCVREQMFDPEKDPPVSERDIGGPDDSIYTVSLCKTLDAWLSIMKQ